jgi:hypothetical protein
MGFWLDYLGEVELSEDLEHLGIYSQNRNVRNVSPKFQDLRIRSIPISGLSGYLFV